MGAYSKGGLIRGGLIKLFDKCHIKSSLSKLVFSILSQEPDDKNSLNLSISLYQSSSSPRVGTYSRGAY